MCPRMEASEYHRTHLPLRTVLHPYWRLAELEFDRVFCQSCRLCAPLPHRF